MSWLEFDVHGYAGLRVAEDMPCAPLFQETFQQFATEHLSQVDLTVTNDRAPLVNAAWAENRYRYTASEVAVHSCKAQISLTERGDFHLRGKGDVLQAALPILDVVMARKGAAMIHAASFEQSGLGIALPAWGGTGKTSTLASLLLGKPTGAFMGDDWAFITQAGDLLGFARPLFIKAHHRELYPHLFTGRRKVMVPAALSGPAHRIASAVHPAVARFPRVAAFTRKWSPEHMMVGPAHVFSRVRAKAPLAAVFFMERWDGPDLELEARPAPWMASRMTGNFYAEMSRASREVMTALNATGLVSLPEPFAQKISILTRATSSKPTFLLRIPSHMSAVEAAPYVGDKILAALHEEGLDRDDAADVGAEKSTPSPDIR